MDFYLNVKDKTIIFIEKNINVNKSLLSWLWQEKIINNKGNR